ncbi:MAG: type II toxin-antitoxin system RelE/ParE family toxin [Azospirillaceae bacterium]
MVDVRYTSAAQKALARLAPDMAARIVAKVERYAADPAGSARNVKALKGAGLTRLRVGDYRVIMDESGTVLLVVRIGHRREAYR